MRGATLAKTITLSVILMLSGSHYEGPREQHRVT